MRNVLGQQGKFFLLALLISAAILPGAAMAQDTKTGASKERPSVEPRTDEETVPDQVIVKFKENAGPSALADARRQEGLVKKKDLGLIDAEVAKVRGQSAEEVVRALERRPDVEYAELDYIVHPRGYTDEPRFSELWGLNNTGQSIKGTSGTANMDLDAPEASSTTQGDENLVVAVIDDGVDFSHPDLEDRAWKNPGESGGGKETNGVDDDNNGRVDDANGWDFYNDDETVFDSSDGDFHGTHVTGSIAASVNGEGVVGVAPNVKIMALKFLGPQGGATSDAILAVQYAKSKGAKLSNNSWGCPPGACYSKALKDAIEASEQLFVAAAGNDHNDNDQTPSYPDSYDLPNILSVAAIGNKGSLASFSNYGAKTVHVSAPGVSILSTMPGGTWDYLNGTSMAAPHATGVAALAASETPSLLDEPGALKQVIMETGKPVSATNGKTVTGDMVDADAAIAADAPSNTPPTISDVLPVNGTSTKNRKPKIEATATDSWTELKASSLTLKIDGKTVPSSSFSYDGNKNRLSYTPATNLPYGKRTVELIATDGQETASETWSFTIKKKKKKR